MERLLDDLGRPQDRLAPVIHVAGTNGKGSVVAFLRAMLEAADLAVHVYTSPHLVRFRERIRVAGRLIEDAALLPLLEEVERVNDGRPITFFEVTTAAAFLAFARARADVVVLETGMGGRLDATNVIPKPFATAITPIGLDHQQYLGETLAEIAGEKAGIFKPDVPAVIGPQPTAVLEVLLESARAVGAPTSCIGRDWQIDIAANGDLRFEGKRRMLELPKPGLAGRHQYDNAGLALAVLDRKTPWRIEQRHLAAGMTSVEWPGRLQRLRRGPLVGRLPPGTELWLDGGHNPSAAVVLAEWAQADENTPPLDLIVGQLRTKPAAEFLRPLAPLARRLIAVPVAGETPCWAPEEIVAAAKEVGIIAAAAASSVREALAVLAVAGASPGRILICGSLYLVGSVLAENQR